MFYVSNKCQKQYWVGTESCTKNRSKDMEDAGNVAALDAKSVIIYQKMQNMSIKPNIIYNRI